MILERLTYSEHDNEPNYWNVSELVFDPAVTLIAGQNATGKTRVMNVLGNLADQITGDRPKLLDGKWSLIYRTEEDNKYAWDLHILKGIVERERITIDGDVVVDREGGRGTIVDRITPKQRDYEPPPDKLTVHARRDKKEYPYLEQLYGWADNYHGFMFASHPPNFLLAGQFDNPFRLKSLASVAQLLQKALTGGVSGSSIVNDFKKVGYAVESVSLGRVVTTDAPPAEALAVSVKEANLKCEVMQSQMSSGMYRALAMVVVINYLLNRKASSTFAVDDIGEGMDYERSMNLMKLLLKKTKNSDIQLILTSNDRHLLNAVDVQSWNILEREGGKVRAFNYANSKEAFDDFAMTGLSNFDFLSGRMYREPKARP